MDVVCCNLQLSVLFFRGRAKFGGMAKVNLSLPKGRPDRRLRLLPHRKVTDVLVYNISCLVGALNMGGCPRRQKDI